MKMPLRSISVISWIPMESRIYKKAQPQVNLRCAFFHILVPQMILISLKTAVHDVRL